MKQFSRIRESENKDSKLKLCFLIKATEEPWTDLKAAGLMVSILRLNWHGQPAHDFSGRAYVASNRMEDLKTAQEELQKRGWTKMLEEG